MEVREALEGLYSAPQQSPAPPAAPSAKAQEQGQKRKGGEQNPQSTSRGRKFPRKGKGKISDKPGNQAVSHDKTPVPQVGSTYQRRSYYLILCSNKGMDMLCEVLFSSLASRDFRMAANVTVWQLKYCTTLALYARLAQLAVECGYIEGHIPEVSQLIKSVTGLQLPAVLARYIECAGKVKLAAGPWVAPWFADRDEMESRYLTVTTLDNLLEQGGRPIPANHWSIDREWIALWNQATTRPARLGMHFRPITWSEINGSIEMVVTPVVSHEVGVDYLRPTAPQIITEVEAQTGSVYHWRDFNQLRHWPAQTALVCTKLTYGTEFYPNDYWSGIVVRSFTAMQ